MRFIIFMLIMYSSTSSALQRKFVMLHIGPNLIVLYLSFKEYIDKLMLFAIHNF